MPKPKQKEKRAWPASSVELWPIEAIHPYPRNARLHSDEQIDLIAASIQQYGFTAPLLVDEEGVLIYGHGRREAALKLGLTDLPVCVAVGWSEEEKSAYRIADNQIALRSTWDMPMLEAELKDLSLYDYDLPSLGFQTSDLSLLGFRPNKTGADSIPEPPTEAASITGDIWLLGDHRLMCGSSTSADDVCKLMKGERADLFATDPPYAVGYSGAERPASNANKGKGGKNWAKVYHEADGDGEKLYREFIKTAIDHAIKQDAAWYCWHSSIRAPMVERLWNEFGAFNHQQIIWVKSRPVLTYSVYLWAHEPCLMGWIKGQKPRSSVKGVELNTSVWIISSDEIESKDHPTSKPIKVFTTPMQVHTKSGDLCYEPFSGSGSQIMAAETMGRRCYAMEISERFVDVAILRWQTYTGKEATLEATGQTFAETQADRKEKGLPAKQGGPRVRVSTS